MGKIYDEIKKEIDNINMLGNKKDLKSLLSKDLSYSKINYLISLINNYYEQTNPNLIHENLTVDDINALSNKISEAEDFIGEDEVLVIANYENFNSPDLAFLDNAYTSEYDHFLVLDTVVKETIKLHYNNQTNSKNLNEVPKEIILAFQKEADNIINKREHVSQISQNDVEYNYIQSFIKNPARSFVNGNRTIFKFQSDNERNEFVKDVDRKAAKNVSQINMSVLSSIDRRLKSRGWLGAEDLTSDIFKTINEYVDEMDQFIAAHPERENEIPSVGIFLYKLKERVGVLAMKDNMMLASDYPSQFLKNFLDNPIDALTKYYDGKLENYNGANPLKNPNFEEENQNKEELIRRALEFKTKIENEREVYNEFAANEDDDWKEHQEYKSEWFLNHFRVWSKDKTIPDALKNNKGGFFENLFGTTSKEYKEFAKGLENMFKDGPGKGDLDGLKKLAENYLVHKLKSGYVPFTNGYDERQIAKLDSTSRGRVELCLSVIQAINEANKSVIARLDPEEFIEPDLDAPEAHDEYWKSGQFEKDLNAFRNNLKNDSEIEQANEKLNEEEINTNSNNIEDIKLDNN